MMESVWKWIARRIYHFMRHGSISGGNWERDGRRRLIGFYPAIVEQENLHVCRIDKDGL